MDAYSGQGGYSALPAWGAKQAIVNKAHGNNGTTYIWLLFNIGNLLDKRVIN